MPEPIRVLHFAGIINRYDIIDVVLTRLDREQFSVRALTVLPPSQVGAYSAGEAYPTRCLGGRLTPAAYPRILRSLIEEILAFRPHILQAHHYSENLLAAFAARLLRVPAYVIGRHYSDHIYYLTRGLKQRVFLAGENWCNRAATRIAVPAADIARLLTERQHVPRERVEVIPFGLDFSRYHPSSELAPREIRQSLGVGDGVLVVACCRLNPEKGLRHLIDAFQQARQGRDDLHLAFVGSGPEEAPLRAMVGEMRLSGAVTFAGWQQQALDWIAASDIVAIPSLCESFCQVLMEGLALGRAVVMTPVGAAPDVLGEDERGLLVPKADPAALAAALSRLAGNPGLRADLGNRGRDFLHTHLDAGLCADRYADLYTRLASR